MVSTAIKNSKRNKAKKKTKLFLLMAFLITIMISSAVVSYTYIIDRIMSSKQLKPIVIDDAEAIFFEVPRGASTSKIASLLREKGLIKSEYLFKILSKVNGYDGLYQQGIHRLGKNLSMDEIMRILTSTPESKKVTVPEGFNFMQIANLLERNKLINKNKFAKIANETKFEFEFLNNVPNTLHLKLEGYLFPDTYNFDLASGEEGILKIMLSNFNRKFKPEYYTRAKELGMTVHQVITLASIIEREAKLAEERSIISGVFHNRLKKKMKLESCATIQYILFMEKGIIKETLTEEDLKIDNIYNTYKYSGLPPGPICNPGEDSIKAALYPDDENEYLYFVAKGDGSHVFSKTLKEHNQAKKKYQSK